MKFTFFTTMIKQVLKTLLRLTENTVLNRFLLKVPYLKTQAIIIKRRAEEAWIRSSDTYGTLYSIGNEPIHRHACFANALRANDNIISIYARYNDNRFFKNQVVLPRPLINIWIKTIKYYFGGIVSVEKISEPYSALKITVDKRTLKYQNKYLSELMVYTCIRYIYEQPFSLILKKAFDLKSKYNKHSLMTWVLLSHIGEQYITDHSIMQAYDYNGDYVYRKFDIRIIKQNINSRSKVPIFSQMKSLTNEEIKIIQKLFKNEGYEYRRK